MTEVDIRELTKEEIEKSIALLHQKSRALCEQLHRLETVEGGDAGQLVETSGRVVELFSQSDGCVLALINKMQEITNARLRALEDAQFGETE